MKKHTFIVILIFVLALSACGGQSELASNTEKWDAQGVTHYRFELTISCFCPFMDIMPVTVEVKDGQIVSLTDVNGQPLADNFRATFEEAATVEGLFAIAAENIADADKVDIVYDMQHGFPTSIIVDRIKLAVDDEISYYVEAFEVLP